MAFGLRSWGAVLAGAGVLLSVGLLPPRAVDPPRQPAPATPERREANRLARELELANRVLARHRWLDSLGAEVDRAVDAGAPAALGLPEVIPSAEREQVARALEEEIRRLGVRRPGVRLGVFVVEADYGGHPALDAYRWTGMWNVEFYAFRKEQNAYCLAVAPVAGADSWRWQMRSLFRAPSALLGRTHMLGPCAFQAAYGPPGPGTGRWLRAGGYVLARLHPAPGDTLLEFPGRRRGIFGIRWMQPGYVLLPPRVEACLAGERSACRRIVSDTLWLLHSGEEKRLQAELPLAHLERPTWRPAAFLARLLADAERGFGRERFARFWTSPLELEAAFAEAFGLPVEEWVYRWARAHLGEEPRGPRLGVGAALLSLLTLGGLASVSAYLSGRRSVA